MNIIYIYIINQNYILCFSFFLYILSSLAFVRVYVTCSENGYDLYYISNHVINDLYMRYILSQEAAMCIAIWILGHIAHPYFG